ncbi:MULTISPECIES: VirK family protein [unclassified Duganella]|uniref:VirK family protein n=1 Tax=unclassified Duganella TaxID=2636909 RepID=UPI001314CA85|nr:MULTISPECIES: VirK family protein [unclassified Duganella]
MFKKIIAGIAIGCATQLALASPTTPLTTVNDLERALMSGANVTVTLDFSKCTNNDVSAAPSSTRGGLKIEAFRILANGTISFADHHETIDSKGLPIMQILRYQVKTDGGVAFTMSTFSLPSYSTIPNVAYTCAVNQGVYFFEDKGPDGRR